MVSNGNSFRLPYFLIIPLLLLFNSGCSQSTKTRTATATATQEIKSNTTQPNPIRSPTYTITQNPESKVNACITAEYLNVRSGPGLVFPIIGSLSGSDCINIDGRNQDGTWVRTESHAWKIGVHGWISVAYLNTEEDFSLLPVRNPDPTPTATRHRPSPTITRWPTATTGLTPRQQPPPGNCDPSYPSICIPPPPPDLDCDDVRVCIYPVYPPDPHNFDGDGDGWGCEVYCW